MFEGLLSLLQGLLINRRLDGKTLVHSCLKIIVLLKNEGQGNESLFLIFVVMLEIIREVPELCFCKLVVYFCGPKQKVGSRNSEAQV